MPGGEPFHSSKFQSRNQGLEATRQPWGLNIKAGWAALLSRGRAEEQFKLIEHWFSIPASKAAFSFFGHNKIPLSWNSRDLGRQRWRCHLHQSTVQIIQDFNERAVGHPTTWEIAGGFNDPLLETKTDSSLAFMVSKSFPAPKGCQRALLSLPPPICSFLFSTPLQFLPSENSTFIFSSCKLRQSHAFLCGPHPSFPLCKTVPKSVFLETFLLIKCHTNNVEGLVPSRQKVLYLSGSRQSLLTWWPCFWKTVYKSGVSESNHIFNAPGHTAILRNPVGLDKAKNHLLRAAGSDPILQFLGFLSWDFHRAFKMGPMFFWSEALGPREGCEDLRTVTRDESWEDAHKCSPARGQCNLPCRRHSTLPSSLRSP